METTMASGRSAGKKTGVDASLWMGLVLIVLSAGCQAAAVLTDAWLVHESDGLGLFETCSNVDCNGTLPSHLKEEWHALRGVEVSGLVATAIALVMVIVHVWLVGRTASMYRWLNTALGVFCWLTGGLILSGGVLLLVTESKHFYEQSEPELSPGYSFALSVSAAILILLSTVAFHYEVIQENRRSSSVKYSRRRRTLRLRPSSPEQ